MSNYEDAYKKWLEQQIKEEISPRRRELLHKGLSRGTVDFLQKI